MKKMFFLMIAWVLGAYTNTQAMEENGIGSWPWTFKLSTNIEALEAYLGGNIGNEKKKFSYVFHKAIRLKGPYRGNESLLHPLGISFQDFINYVNDNWKKSKVINSISNDLITIVNDVKEGRINSNYFSNELKEALLIEDEEWPNSNESKKFFQAYYVNKGDFRSEEERNNNNGRGTIIAEEDPESSLGLVANISERNLGIFTCDDLAEDQSMLTQEEKQLLLQLRHKKNNHQNDRVNTSSLSLGEEEILQDLERKVTFKLKSFLLQYDSISKNYNSSIAGNYFKWRTLLKEGDNYDLLLFMKNSPFYGDPQVSDENYRNALQYALGSTFNRFLQDYPTKQNEVKAGFKEILRISGVNDIIPIEIGSEAIVFDRRIFQRPLEKQLIKLKNFDLRDFQDEGLIQQIDTILQGESSLPGIRNRYVKFLHTFGDKKFSNDKAENILRFMINKKVLSDGRMAEGEELKIMVNVLFKAAQGFSQNNKKLEDIEEIFFSDENIQSLNDKQKAHAQVSYIMAAKKLGELQNEQDLGLTITDALNRKFPSQERPWTLKGVNRIYEYYKENIIS